MAYSTQTDLENALRSEDDLVALTDKVGAGEVNTGRVDSAIAEADALINSYAQKLYSVPLDPVPDSIKFCSARLARWFLISSNRMPTERDVLAYENDIAWLDKVAAGDVALGLEPLAEESPDYVQAKHTSEASDRQVRRDALKGYS